MFYQPIKRGDQNAAGCRGHTRIQPRVGIKPECLRGPGTARLGIQKKRADQITRIDGFLDEFLVSRLLRPIDKHDVTGDGFRLRQRNLSDEVSVGFFCPNWLAGLSFRVVVDIDVGNTV